MEAEKLQTLLKGNVDGAAYTHILLVNRSQNALRLFRASDGILICMQQNAVVVFGEDPKTKNSHTFIDLAAAENWLMGVYPARDLKAQNSDALPILEIRDDEKHGLYVPQDSLELPGMGAYNPMRKFS